jgi:hypothetical protein
MGFFIGATALSFLAQPTRLADPARRPRAMRRLSGDALRGGGRPGATANAHIACRASERDSVLDVG